MLYGTNKRAVKNRNGRGSANWIAIKSAKLTGTAIRASNLWREDWAILKLSKPIKLGPNAQKVELGTLAEFINDVMVSFRIDETFELKILGAEEKVYGNWKWKDKC